MPAACHVCHSEHFTVNEGFSYCDNCGTQSQFYQELQHDGFFASTENRQTKTATLKLATDSKNEFQLTTWEGYNYIMFGLVNELISLGAKKELKMTALQLWSAYLRANEVAFFSRKKNTLPKLSASFKKKDAEIIYSLKADQRKRKRQRASQKSAAASTDGAASSNSDHTTKRAYRRLQRNLMSAEYDAYQTDLETNTSMSVLNRSTDGSTSAQSSRTSASSAPITIEFSRLSKRFLRKTLQKKHLHRHQQNATLDCHTFERKNYARRYHPEVLSRQTLFELLYLALNQCDDDIQLGDMLRYIREGHLSFIDALKFLPDGLNAQQKYYLAKAYNSSSTACPTHAFVRFGAGNLARLLGVRPRVPSMRQLTRRYVQELALPPAVATLIETLLTVCAPQMRQPAGGGKPQLPLYEGRAVALVLFALKLLFGVDDRREVRISERAQRINERVRKLPSGDRRPLFVWTEWMRYVEMRNVILGQCHYATASALQPNAPAEYAHLYADFVRTHDEQNEQVDEAGLAPGSHRRNDRSGMLNFGIVLGKAAQLHARQRDEVGRGDAQRREALRFEATLQPKSAYLERLLEDAVMATTVHIPGFMHVHHGARDVVPFLRPGELRRRLAAGGDEEIRLRVVRLSGAEGFHFDRPFLAIWPERRKPFTNTLSLRSFDFGISNDDWLDECRQMDKMEQDRIVDNQDIIRKAVLHNLSNMKTTLNIHRKRRGAKATKATSNSPDATKPDAKDRKDYPDSDDDDDNIGTNTDMLNVSTELFSQGDHESIPAAQTLLQPAARGLSPQREADVDVPLFEMVLSDDNNDSDANNEDNEDDGDDGEPLEFCVNDFDYWMCTGRLDEMRHSVFKELCARHLPQNFVWLLRQCAQLVECNERDVYRELLIVENFYAYRLAPFEQMRNMPLYRPERRQMHIPELRKSVQHFSPHW